jgi:Na+/proline symporter
VCGAQQRPSTRATTTSRKGLSLHLGITDVAILAAYAIAVLGIGFMLRGRVSGGADILLAGRSIPAWMAGLTFLSANLGAQEMISMGGERRQVRMLTSHFYWFGAVPAMIFVGVFMMLCLTKKSVLVAAFDVAAGDGYALAMMSVLVARS